MSAFGKRGAMTHGAKPAFGVARPMQGDAAAGPLTGGLQFPPLDAAPLSGSDPFAGLPSFDDPINIDENEVALPKHADAMARLAIREAASGDAGRSRVEGFEASIHKIKEQVLPRLLERVDPEAAASLS